MRTRIASVLAFILAPLALPALCPAQSTAFTYQGELKIRNQPASGLHDLRFRLFDAAANGTQVGATLCANNVAVADGVFTVQLDFGQQFSTPAARHLEISVRSDIGQPCTDVFAYVVLAPRQTLTATPLAIHAKSAFSLDAGDGSPANAVFVDNAGKVGIGTTAPTHSVHVATVGPALALQDTAAASQQAGYVSYRDNANTERAWVGYGTPGSPDFSIINARPGGDIVLTPLSGDNVVLVSNGGNVGIGTSAPAARLDVRGDIKHGASGQYFATGGGERLRIVRGDVDRDGSIIRGTGFTCTRIGTGGYEVRFTTSFQGTPSVFIQAEHLLGGDVRIGDIFNVTPTGGYVHIRGTTSDWVNSGFSFFAIGPG